MNDDHGIVLIIFNRPDLTEMCFEHIRRERPRVLLIVADGPRPDHPKDDALCRQTRAVTERVDWPCEVLRKYFDVNLGCGEAPAAGVTWAFEHVDRAIIMEDDCMPAASLFDYCWTMLDRYADDPRIMHVNCCNFLFGRRFTRGSYYFSKYVHGQIWATWRRAWESFDYDMRSWPQFRASQTFVRMCDGPFEHRYWRDVFDRVYEEPRKTCWDYQWMLACWEREALSVTPSANLVSNFGFRADGTHVVSANHLACMPIEEVTDVSEMIEVRRCDRADRYVFSEAYGGKQFRQQFSKWHRLKRILGRPIRGHARR